MLASFRYTVPLIFHPDTAHSTDIATKWQLDLSRDLRNTHGFGTLSFSWGQAWLLPLSTKVKILLYAIYSITTTPIFPPLVPNLDPHRYSISSVTTTLTLPPH